MPREVVFAPESITGIGLTSLEHKQGIDHIKALIRHKCEGGGVGNLMTILAQTCQLLSGQEQSIFEGPFHTVEYSQEFKQKWMLKVRENIVQSQTNLHFWDHLTPHLCTGMMAECGDVCIRKRGWEPQNTSPLKHSFMRG